MTQYDPFDLEGLEARDADVRARALVQSTTAEGDLVWLMSGPRGRRIVARILREAQLDLSSYHPNAMEMARLEGRKELARGLRRLIDQLCPERYVQMLQEQETDEQAATGRSDNRA